MADVFLSYARADEAVARRVAKALQATGLHVWWDADLPAHRAYSEVIEHNLESARAVVVLWSKSAAKSQWVRAEADFARNAGKLVQAKLDDTLPPIPFNQIQCAPLKGWRGGGSHAGWAKLNGSVQALVSGDEAAPPPIAPRPTLKDRASDRRLWALAFALLIAVLAAGYYFIGAGEERKPVLAILPFKSLDSQDASLVAGIWEDTRTAIGRNPQIVVLGPNTAEQLAGKGEEAVKKAADYMLEASVRTAGDRIRVSADLVRTRDGSQVWSQDFDRKLDDVFALQSQIAGEIEGRIRGRLAEKGGATPEHIATSGDVYALYTDARAKLRTRNNAVYPAAVDQLKQALKIDPNYAPAWASLAIAESFLVPSQRNFSTINPAQPYARKAIELAPNLASAHSALALALNLRGPVALSELKQAVALDPNDFEALNWLSGMQHDAGQNAEAIATLQRAVEVEPLFWPAVMNLYSQLKDQGDEAGIKRLLDSKRAIGADYFAEAIEMNEAANAGDYGRAVNIGLAAWNKGNPNARTLISRSLWAYLIQLGFDDQAFATGPAPDFARALWEDDEKGLRMVEKHGLPPKVFMTLAPLIQNAARVYLIHGQPQPVASGYLALAITPDQYANAFDDPEEFLTAAPLVALSLSKTGHEADAKALLAVAEQRGAAFQRGGTPQSSVWLARIYALEGRKDEALSLLTSAVARRWLPPPPEFHPDIANDPALATLKGEPRLEAARKQILDTIARQRAAVDPKLLAQFKAA